MKRRVFIFFFICLLLSTAVFSFFRSSVFAVKHVEVTGNKYLTSKEIEVMSGAVIGANIFKVDSESITESLKRIGKIKSVSVKKAYPSKIILHVEERSGVAVIPYMEYFLEVGDDAKVICVLKNLSGINLPIITGLSPEYVAVGESIEPVKYNSAIKAASLFDPEVRSEVSEININPENGDIRIIMEDGTRVLFGKDEDLEKKSMILNEIWLKGDLKRHRVEYIDIRYDANPVVKMRD